MCSPGLRVHADGLRETSHWFITSAVGACHDKQTPHSVYCHRAGYGTDALRRITPEYLTAQQVATLTGFTPKALEGFRARGTGPPYFKIGARIRYRLADVRAMG